MQSDLSQDQQHDPERDADTVHQQHDASYKFLLSSKKLFVEFIHSFINRQWAKEIEEDQVEYALIDVERHTEEELLSLSNTLSAVFLLDQTQDQEQLLNRLAKLFNVFKRLPEEGQQNFLPG